MAAITFVRTVDNVARELGIDAEVISDFAYPNMDPEHGRIWVHDVNREVMAFTPDGVDHLKELIADLRPDLLQR